MLMPSIFGENLFDDFFNDFPFYDDNAGQKIEAVWTPWTEPDEDRYQGNGRWL